MADRKKQHYVPQFYLRNFSKDGKTIGCGYVDAEKPLVIENAPIKSQAAEDYFYTKDTRLETAFSQIEGSAREIIHKIVTSDAGLNCKEKNYLKQFICFQRLRTPFIANYFESEMNKMFNHFNGTEDGEKRIELQGRQIFVLSTLQESTKSIRRYKLLLLDNQTEIPFITSPEPAVFFNPYKSKRKQYIGGVETYGGMIFYPLSAKKGVLLYDRRAYRVKSRPCVSCSISDVSNLNAQIFITMHISRTNVFYYDNRANKKDALGALSQMKNYIGDYANLDFICERFRLLKF